MIKKLLIYTSYIFLIANIICCSKGIKSLPATADDFEKIEKEIITKFGNDSYFTELSISHNEITGNKIEVTVTQKPESLKIEEWINTNGNWIQRTEISFEIPEGMKASDFMFQLNKDIKLKSISKLIEKSKTNLKEEKNINNVILDIATIKFPKNGDFSKTEFIVKLKPNCKNTIFSFNYLLNEIETKS